MASSICPICCDESDFEAYTNCEHRTCAKCTLIEKILCKSDKCLLCSKQHPKIVIAPSSTQIQSFHYYLEKNELHEFAKYGVLVHPAANIFVQELENPSCPKCKMQFASFYEMSKHMQEAHHSEYCRICCRHKPVFYVDQAYYEGEGIHNHLAEHPVCELCSERQYDDEARADHYKVSHVRCELCRAFEINDSYWDDIHALEEHISEAHFACLFRECNIDGYGFSTEDDQLEHLIEVHEAQIEPVRLVDMQHRLNTLRRQKKIIDFAKLEDMRQQYSIEARVPSKVKKQTEQQDEDTEAQIYTYIAELTSKKKKTTEREEEHADVDTYVEYVEPDKSQEPKYRGIQKQADVSIVLNQGESPGADFKEESINEREIDNIFGSAAFKVVKQKKTKASMKEQEAQEEIGESNKNLLEETMFSEFEEQKEEFRQLFEIEKTENNEEREEEETNDFLGIKKVKDKKGKRKETYEVQQDTESVEEAAPLFIISASVGAECKAEAGDGDTQMQIAVKKAKSAKSEKSNQIESERELLFELSVPDEVQPGTLIEVNTKDVQKNTVPDSHIDGEIFCKVCKKKEKKKQNDQDSQKSDEPFVPLLNFDVPIVQSAEHEQEPPKKELFKIEVKEPMEEETIKDQPAIAKDVQKNTVPESHVDGTLQIKECKQKQKKSVAETTNISDPTLVVDTVSEEPESNDIIITKGKSKKAGEYHEAPPAETEQLILNLNMTEEELRRLKEPVGQPIFKEVPIIELAPEEVSNDIYIDIPQIFNYVPVSVKIIRVINRCVASSLSVEFCYSKAFLSELKAMFLTFSSEQQRIVEERMKLCKLELFGNYQASDNDFLIERLSDFSKMKPFIWAVSTGSTFQVNNVSELIKECIIYVNGDFAKNKKFSIHFSGNNTIEQQLDIFKNLFDIDLHDCIKADNSTFSQLEVPSSF